MATDICADFAALNWSFCTHLGAQVFKFCLVTLLHILSRAAASAALEDDALSKKMDSEQRSVGVFGSP